MLLMARQHIINESVLQIKKTEKVQILQNFFRKRVNKRGFTYASFIVRFFEENSIAFNILLIWGGLDR